VQLPGKATQKVFDEALTILARDAPPVPGFRKSKGGTDPHQCVVTSPLRIIDILASHLGFSMFSYKNRFTFAFTE
jgi:hypothetical protein